MPAVVGHIWYGVPQSGDRSSRDHPAQGFRYQPFGNRQQTRYRQGKRLPRSRWRSRRCSPSAVTGRFIMSIGSALGADLRVRRTRTDAVLEEQEVRTKRWLDGLRRFDRYRVLRFGDLHVRRERSNARRKGGITLACIGVEWLEAISCRLRPRPCTQRACSQPNTSRRPYRLLRSG